MQHRLGPARGELEHHAEIRRAADTDNPARSVIFSSQNLSLMARLAALIPEGNKEEKNMTKQLPKTDTSAVSVAD